MTTVRLRRLPRGQTQKKRQATNRAQLATRTAEAVFAVVLTVFIIGPLVWLILGAFATSWTFPRLLPDSWTLSWWTGVFAYPGLFHAMWLSLQFACVVTVASAMLCLPAAYAFARWDFPGRRFFLISLFATNSFPAIGLYISIAGLFYSLHLMQTFAGVVIVQLIGTIVYMVWIPAASFAAFDRTLEEAARDAGARRLRVFCGVTIRLALPGIIVALILTFLGAFDESQGTFVVGAPRYLTMPLDMYSVVGHYPEQGASVFALLMTVPSIVLLALVRRHIISGHLARGFQLR